MNRLIERWNGFWHANGSPFALALFRVLFAYCLWDEVSTTRSRSVFAIEGGGFHLPYLDFLPLLPAWLYEFVHDVQFVFIVLFGLGLFTRFSCFTLLALQSYVYFADQLHFRNHPYFFLLVLLIMLFSPAGEALALGPLIRARRTGGSMLEALMGGSHPLTMQRLIQVQLCLVYIFAGLHKLRPAFMEGAVLHRNLVRDLPDGDSGELLALFMTTEQMASLLATGWVFLALAWATIVLELGLPIALWPRRSRPIAILFGTLFHLSIAFIMSIHVFSYSVIASYLLFLEPETLPRLFRRVVSRFQPGSRHLSESESA